MEHSLKHTTGGALEQEASGKAIDSLTPEKSQNEIETQTSSMSPVSPETSEDQHIQPQS